MFKGRDFMVQLLAANLTGANGAGIAVAGGGALPLVDLSEPNFAARLDASFRDTGFVAVSGFKEEEIFPLRDAVYRDWKDFVSFPPSLKKKYHTDPTGQRGFTPDGAESKNLFTELRAHMMIARSLPVGHPLLVCRPLFYAPNVEVAEVTTLVSNTEKLLGALERLALQLFESVEVYLDLPFGTIASTLVRGEMLMRLHHYPKAEVVASRVLDGVHTVYGADVNGVEVVDVKMRDGSTKENVLRAGPHSDTGHCTILLGTEVAGLCVQKRDGAALRFTTRPGTIAFQVADFLEHIVSGWHSSIHWVSLTEESAKADRYSMADFLHQRPTAKAGPFINGALLFHRLWEIGYINDQEGRPDMALRDTLINQVNALPPDAVLIPQILIWENWALSQGLIAKPELGRYYHLHNRKTGVYLRRPEPEEEI